jgi:hypothetical protein
VIYEAEALTVQCKPRRFRRIFMTAHRSCAMHPEDLMKSDLQCELLVKAGGMVILLFLLLIMVLALTQVSAQF